jgi:hypothetical protein
LKFFGVSVKSYANDAGSLITLVILNFFTKFCTLKDLKIGFQRAKIGSKKQKWQPKEFKSKKVQKMYHTQNQKWVKIDVTNKKALV